MRCKLKPIYLFFWAALGFLLAVESASAQAKVALVIGNSDYRHVPKLDNPSNDAVGIGAALERIGFSVTTELDLDQEQMRKALQKYSEAAKQSEISIAYFAGHGIEIDKSNFLLPVDATLNDDQDVQLEALQLHQILKQVSSESGITLMLVDACRDNPFVSHLVESGTTRSIGTGLVRVNPEGGTLPGGILVSYAAREGEFALDGETGNSPYAAGLLKHLEEPGLEVSKFFRRVRDSVFENTKGLQEPFTYGSLPSKDIYLAGLPKSSVNALGTIELLSELSPKEQEKALKIGVDGFQKIQSLLSALGYEPGPVDGFVGGKTRSAISAFQTTSKLEVSGFATNETIKRLSETYLSAPSSLNGIWRLSLDRKTIRNLPSHNDTVGFVHTMGFIEFEIDNHEINVIRTVNLSNAPNPREPNLRATIDRNRHLEMSAVVNYVFFKDDSRRVFSAISLPERTAVGRKFTISGGKLNQYYQYQNTLQRQSSD